MAQTHHLGKGSGFKKAAPFTQAGPHANAKGHKAPKGDLCVGNPKSHTGGNPGENHGGGKRH